MKKSNHIFFIVLFLVLLLNLNLGMKNISGSNLDNTSNICPFNAQSFECYPFPVSFALDGMYSDYAKDIVPDKDQNFVIVGSSDSPNFPIKNNKTTPIGVGFHGFITKVDKTSNIIWSELFAYTLKELAIDSNNNIIVVGENELNVGIVAKVNSDGTLIWNKTFAAPVSDVAVNKDNKIGFIIGSNFLEYSSEGSILANVSIGENVTLTAITSDSIGNYIVAGYVTNSVGWNTLAPLSKSTYKDVVFAYINVSRLVEWKYAFGGEGHDIATRIAIDSQNNLVIIGTTESVNFPLYHSDSRYCSNNIHVGFVTKINLNTSVVVFSLLFGNGNIEMTGLAILNNDHIFLSGTANNDAGFPRRNICSSTIFHTSEIFIAEFSRNGFLLVSGILGFIGLQKSENLNVDKNSGNLLLVGTTESDTFPYRNASSLKYPSTKAGLVGVLEPYAYPFRTGPIAFPNQNLTYHEEIERYWQSGLNEQLYFKYNISRDQTIQFINHDDYMEMVLTNLESIKFTDFKNGIKNVPVQKWFVGWSDSASVSDPTKLREYRELSLGETITNRIKLLVDYETGHIVEHQVLNSEFNESYPYFIYGIHFPESLESYTNKIYAYSALKHVVSRDHQDILYNVSKMNVGDLATFDLGVFNYSVNYTKILYGRDTNVLLYEYINSDNSSKRYYYGYDKESGLLLKRALTDITFKYYQYGILEIIKETQVREITSSSFIYNGKTIQLNNGNILGWVIGIGVAGVAVYIVSVFIKRKKIK
jgi:hypothetical protein